MLAFIAAPESIPALIVDPTSRVNNPIGACIGLVVVNSAVPAIGERLESLVYDYETVQSLYYVLEYAQTFIGSNTGGYLLDIDDYSYRYCQNKGLYISGDSMTLSFLFGVILQSQANPWPRSTFVTGAVNKNRYGWRCESVGLFKSKLRLAADYGYQHFFVPETNLKMINSSLYDTSKLIQMPRSLGSCIDLWTAFINDK